MRFEVSTKKRHVQRKGSKGAPPPYQERAGWCSDMTAELMQQLEAHSDGSSAHTTALRQRVHALQATMTSHLIATQQLLASPPRDSEAARVRCVMLVHDSDILESECNMLEAEAKAVTREVKAVEHGEREDKGERSEVEGVEDRVGDVSIRARAK